MEESAKRKNTAIVVIIVLIVLAVCALIAGLLYMNAQAQRRNRELVSALEQSEMTAAVLKTGREQKMLISAAKAENEQAERDARLALKEQFLGNERKELLTLVNFRNMISDDYHPRVTDIGDGLLLDRRASGALREMLDDCMKAGGSPCPISAYRTGEYQQELYDNKVMRVMAQGYSAEEAPDKAATQVARPGTSEHQLGLAVDIVDSYYPELDYQQEWTGTQRWLMTHCADYGFILRYPTDSSEITGVIYEPWHYRYVGKSEAKEIASAGITLEEYLGETGAHS